MIFGEQGQLPDEIGEHVPEWLGSRVEVIEVSDPMEAVRLSAN